MRKAFHANNLIPDKKWLIYTSLMWDKVVLEPFDKVDVDVLPEWKDNTEFALNMIHKTNIVEYQLPSPKYELLSEKELATWNNSKEQIIDESSIVLSAIRAKAKSIIELSEKHNLQKGGHKSADGRILEDIEILAESIKSMQTKLLSRVEKAHFPIQYQHAFPDIDFFYNSNDEFIANHNINECIVTSVEAIMPLNINNISINKIEEFRVRYLAHREKFRKEAKELITNIHESSTDNELKNNLKACEEAIVREIDILNSSFRKCMIDTTKQTVGITLGAPALVAALSSLLNTPFYMPAAVISSISISSAEILSSFEKAENETSKSPWAYLWYLRKTFR